MKFKKLILVIAAAVFSLALSTAAYAGAAYQFTGSSSPTPGGARYTQTWHLDADGWRYYTNNGSYYNSGWQWVDGDQNGISECYYFQGNGVILTNTTTPDGYQVNGDGAWVQNGVVQTQGAQAQQPNFTNNIGGGDYGCLQGNWREERWSQNGQRYMTLPEEAARVTISGTGISYDCMGTHTLANIIDGTAKANDSLVRDGLKDVRYIFYGEADGIGAVARTSGTPNDMYLVIATLDGLLLYLIPA